MLPIWFIYVAAMLRLLGGLAYLRATLQGKALPNPLSWLLWSATPMIAFFAELSAGVGIAALVTLALGISPLLVFVATIYKNPRLFKLDRFNATCALLAITGIVLWVLTDHPQLAIALAILADIASSLPTIKKTIHRPHTEYAPTYAISAFSMILTLLTIRSWSFASAAFPIYILTINIYIVFLIIGGKLRKFIIKKKKRRSSRQMRRLRTRLARL